METQGAVIAKQVFAVDVQWGKNLTERKSPRENNRRPDGLAVFVLPRVLDVLKGDDHELRFERRIQS
jgi:hypothetical protein